ncbi:MAG: YmdB family metallophosphoesterase [Rhodospirillaceae bacterium]|jgi:metallophosphoesterase (TIGR00282 family)|nr:YmdB family metallophosphoesterase [Rhodospirillaceae bacterium]
MRLLFCGDVVGRSGRTVIIKQIPLLRQILNLDFVCVNGENSAHGFGITPKICDEFFIAGVDVITLGNHTWDRQEIIPYLNSELRILRPCNYPHEMPGRGTGIYITSCNKKVMVIQVLGRLFMDYSFDNPFVVIENELSNHRLGNTVHAIILDVHCEASSEKMALGHYFDGRVSLVIGSHSHIPTADAQILTSGTAYQTDAGMCGDYNSVIGMEKDVAISHLIHKFPNKRLSPAEKHGTLCAVFVETDDVSGLAKKIEPVRIGHHLNQTIPIV